MKKRFIATAIAGLLAGGASLSHAGNILFDPDGNDGALGAIIISGFDWSPGNMLAKGCVATPALCSFHGQAKLGAFSGNSASATLGGTAEFTFVFSVPVISTGAALGTLQTMTLTPLAGGPTSFTMYYQRAGGAYGAPDANDLTSQDGTGFDNGHAILSGVINFFPSPGVTTPANIGQFTTNNTSYSNLDNHAGDSTIGAIQSISVAGSADFSIDVTSYDANWFLTDISKVNMDLAFSSSAVTPFSQVEPAMNQAGAAGGGVAGNTPFLGADGTNDFKCEVAPTPEGTKCDFIFQADGSNTFEASVPEPHTMAILGLGLLGLVGFRRKWLSR